jgi:hypothetical protein
MAKPSIEHELVLGMQQELQPYEKKQAMTNLVKAAEYLNSAMEILEDAGLTAKADRVLRILAKIAQEQDINQAKLSSDEEFYQKIMKWLDDPKTPVDPEHPQPGEELSFNSLLTEPAKDELTFQSLLTQKNDPKPSNDDLLFKSIAMELDEDDELVNLQDEDQESDEDDLFEDAD